MVYNTVTDSALAVPPSASWLMPLRDLVSVAVLIASFCGTSVTWREQKFRVAADGQLTLDGDLRP
jgi:ceramide glucosyltransferase